MQHADQAKATSRRPFDQVFGKPVRALICVTGLMGACGVAISAAAAHAGGGSLAATAGLFLILHASTSLALSAHAAGSGNRFFMVAAWLLLVGTGMFAADLTLAGLWALRPLPVAAPIGGVMMIAGWLTIPVVVVVDAVRRRALTSCHGQSLDVP